MNATKILWDESCMFVLCVCLFLSVSFVLSAGCDSLWLVLVVFCIHTNQSYCLQYILLKSHNQAFDHN